MSEQPQVDASTIKPISGDVVARAQAEVQHVNATIDQALSAKGLSPMESTASSPVPAPDLASRVQNEVQNVNTTIDQALASKGLAPKEQVSSTPLPVTATK